MTAIAAERLLPHNLDAERSTLASVLLTHGKALDAIADRLEDKHFYRNAHQRIYRAMVALYARGDAVDFVTLCEALKQAGDLDEIGGKAYVGSLTDGMPSSVNVGYYARIVREKSTKRDVIYAANRILTQAYADDDLAELVDETERALLDVSTDASPGDLVHARELVQRVAPVLAELATSRRPVTGLSTGFSDLDRFTRGLQPGNLILVAGRPGHGKSTIGTQIAIHVARTTPVAFFSLEMAQLEQTMRIVASMARVDGHALQCGQLPMMDMPQVDDALATFERYHFWLDDTAGLSPLQIRSRARRLKAQHGLGLIVVDYIQLLKHLKAESREQAVATSGRLLLQLGRELSVPVLALCQLNRKSEERQDKRPQLSDLRESGSLEQDANVVLLIHRPVRQPGDVAGPPPPSELIIAKQRNGPTNSIDLHWMAEQYRFAEVETHR